MQDDEDEPGYDERPRCRVQIEIPVEMLETFPQWWDSEGWWNYRVWHERRSKAGSEWERFMRHVCGEPPPAEKHPAVCSDPFNTTAA